MLSCSGYRDKLITHPESESTISDYKRHATGKGKSETHTEFLMGRNDEEDILEEADIYEYAT